MLFNHNFHISACVVDMYIDDKANLPWNNKARYASMYGRKSKGVLRSQYPNDKPAYLYRRTGIGIVCSSLLF
jgi:hypothetical protein